jgi:haloacetate dehalogenase
MKQPEAAFFAGFRVHRWTRGEVTVHAEMGGTGPALLLLHGYPQNHLAWHRVAPTAGSHFTVVAANLRGYGDSLGPPGDPQQLNSSKRAKNVETGRRVLGDEGIPLVYVCSSL